MNINEIKDPKFLKSLNTNELRILANDIRSFLIENVSKTGGHLSSNLGVVELTIALHYVFDAPEDKFLFDVGHQSYIHKILTGRAEQMPTLRQYNGLSGFQKRNESIYDCFEAGHSSTALSTSLGMAIARDLNNEKYNVVAIVGDGALANGLSLEALNHIGDEKRPLIIIFNDNNMSINKNVGALTRAFAQLRNSNPYNQLKENVKDFLKDKKFGTNVISGIRNVKDAIKGAVVNSGIFNDFDIDYLGPVDGHDIDALIKAFKAAKKREHPVVVHCVTTKGYGYKFAQDDDIGLWHGVGKFNIDTGEFLYTTPSGYANSSKIVANTVDKIMAENKDVVTITPAMINGSCLNDIFAKYPTRAFDCGIAEDHALTLASGLALNGKKPFVSIYSSFLQRAYDQLNHDLCRMNLPVVLGIDRASLVGEDGETHHGVYDISFARSLPNVTICEGKDADELEDLVYSAFDNNGPTLIRYSKDVLKVDENHKLTKINLGTWEYLVNNDNEEAIIISYGFDLIKIKEMIINNNYNYTLVNARFIKPIDEDMLHELLLRNKPIFLYTSDIIKGGLGDEILEYINKHEFTNKIHIIGIDDIYVKHGSNVLLKEDLGIDIKSLFKYIEEDIND